MRGTRLLALTAAVMMALPVGLSAERAYAGSHAAAPASSTASRDLVMERDLLGRSKGRGFFSNILGQRRDFTVDFDGRWDGKTLTLGEVIRFDDGAVERYTWRLTKTGPNTYTGVREGVVGQAVVVANGREVVMEYTADVKGPDGGVTRLRFEDVLIKRGNGSILNRARAYLGGLQVGWVSIDITRR